MTNEEKILEMLAEMQKDLAKVKSDVAEVKFDIVEIKSDIVSLKESGEVTRSGVESLLDWADECGRTVSFPLPEVK